MSQAEIICKKCGTGNPPHSNFCLRCGSMLRKASKSLDTLFYLHAVGLSYLALSFFLTFALIGEISTISTLLAIALSAYVIKLTRSGLLTRNLRIFSITTSSLSIWSILLMEVFSPGSLVFVGMVIFIASIARAIRERPEDKGLISPNGKK